MSQFRNLLMQTNDKPNNNGHPYVDVGLVLNDAPVYFAKGNLNGVDGQVEEYETGSYFGKLYVDEAQRELGGDWTMECENAYRALLDETKYSWTNTWIGGIRGYKVMKIGETNTDNYIFLPLCGSYSGSTLYNKNTYGYYWLNQLGTYVLDLGNTVKQFRIGSQASYFDARPIPIRPVLIGKKKSNGRIPSGCTECEYITASGTQYVDLNLEPSDDLEFEAVIVPTSTNANTFFGTGYVANGRFAFGKVPQVGAKYYSHPSWVVNKEYEVSYKNKIYKSVQNFDFSGQYIGDLQKGKTLYLFAQGTSNYFIGHIKAFRAWKSGELVFDYVPMLDKNNIFCVYNAVTNTTHYNIGTGAFGGKIKESGAVINPT